MRPECFRAETFQAQFRQTLLEACPLQINTQTVVVFLMSTFLWLNVNQEVRIATLTPVTVDNLTIKTIFL